MPRKLKLKVLIHLKLIITTKTMLLRTKLLLELVPKIILALQRNQLKKFMRTTIGKLTASKNGWSLHQVSKGVILVVGLTSDSHSF